MRGTRQDLPRHETIIGDPKKKKADARKKIESVKHRVDFGSVGCDPGRGATIYVERRFYRCEHYPTLVSK